MCAIAWKARSAAAIQVRSPNVIAAFASAAEPVEVSFRWRPQLRDPGDELVLEAAVKGRAEALVTHNVGDFVPAMRLFDVRVLTPREFLKELEP